VRIAFPGDGRRDGLRPASRWWSSRRQGLRGDHLYRTKRGEAAKVRLRIALEDGTALCRYGGKVETTRSTAASTV